MAKILPAPYLKGELGTPAKAERLLHILMALTFVALPVSNLTIKYQGGESFFQVYGIIYLVIFALGIWIESLGRNRSPFQPIDVLLFVVTVSGMIGIALQGFRAQFLYRDTIAFTIFLLIRNFSLFVMVPRSMLVSQKRMVQMAERWLFLGAMLLLIATFVYATSNGVTLVTGRFFEENWLHPNWIAVYSGLVMLMALVSKNLKPWEKISLAHLLAVYMALMMQSRAIIVAMVGTYLVLYFFAIGRDKAKGTDQHGRCPRGRLSCYFGPWTCSRSNLLPLRT